MISQSKHLLLLTLCALLLACNPSQNNGQKLALIEQDKTITPLSCDHFASVTTPIGDLQNNVWNAHPAGDYKWTQCVASRSVEDPIHGKQTQYGWYWQWPANGTQVYAQPQITLGNSPWLNHTSNKSNYPISI